MAARYSSSSSQGSSSHHKEKVQEEPGVLEHEDREYQEGEAPKVLLLHAGEGKGEALHHRQRNLDER